MRRNTGEPTPDVYPLFRKLSIGGSDTECRTRLSGINLLVSRDAMLLQTICVTRVSIIASSDLRGLTSTKCKKRAQKSFILDGVEHPWVTHSSSSAPSKRCRFAPQGIASTHRSHPVVTIRLRTGLSTVLGVASAECCGDQPFVVPWCNTTSLRTVKRYSTYFKCRAVHEAVGKHVPVAPSMIPVGCSTNIPIVSRMYTPIHGPKEPYPPPRRQLSNR